MSAHLVAEADDVSDAFDGLLDALREDLTDEVVARKLVSAARVGDRFGDLLVACADWLRDPGLTSVARVALLTRVGVWYGDELGKPSWGLPYLEEARSIAPNNIRVLRSIVRVRSREGTLSACEPVLRRILELDPSDREAADVLERIMLARGAIYDLVAFFEHRLRESGSVALNPLRLKLAGLHGALPGGDGRACELLAEAHTLDSGDLQVLRALDARLSASERWNELVMVLEERIERTESMRERVELLVRLARVHTDRERAREHYREALELDPSNTSVLSSLRALALDSGDAPEAARLLDREQRHTNDLRARARLLVELATLRRDRLNDPRGSEHAFEEAYALDPNNREAALAVAEAQIERSEWSGALAELQRAIARDPMSIALHRALYRLHARRGDLDRAYCVASVLVFLKGADAEQRACYTELRPRGAPRFAASLGRAAWIRDLAHPELDRAIGGVFEVVARVAEPAPSIALTGVEREALFDAASVLGVEPTLCELEAPLPAAIPELMFVFGKQLTVQNGEHRVRARGPSVIELETLLAAAIRIAVPEFKPRTCAAEAVQRVHDSLARKLRSDERDRLLHLAPNLVDLGPRAEVKRWMQCSELTAVRAGLLLCGDLSIAAKVLRSGTTAPDGLSSNEKVRELVRFTVSDAYARLRDTLGIAVRPRSAVTDDDDEPTRDRALCA